MAQGAEMQANQKKTMDIKEKRSLGERIQGIQPGDRKRSPGGGRMYINKTHACPDSEKIVFSFLRFNLDLFNLYVSIKLDVSGHPWASLWGPLGS